MSAYRITQAGSLHREEIFGFLGRVFPDHADPRRVHEGIMRHEPSIKPENFILARSVSGELIGLIRIVERWLMVDGCALACAGITWVAVREDWRSQGVCARMMQMTIDRLMERRFDVAVLHARKVLDGFYTPLNFWGVGRYLQLEIDVPKAANDTLTAKDYDSKYRDHCQRLYRQEYAPLSGAMKRDAGIWEFIGAQISTHGSLSLQLLFQGKSMVGYFAKNEKGQMIELCLPQRYYAPLASGLEKYKIKHLAIHPLHPFFHFCRRQYNTVFTERLALNGGYQARLLDVASVLKHLMPAFRRRAAGWKEKDKKVSFLGHQLDLVQGRITASRTKDVIGLASGHRLVQALLGSLPPDEVQGIQWPKAKPWLKELFPYLHFHTNSLDEF
jgi:predicted GNAT family N-acyltransferase